MDGGKSYLKHGYLNLLANIRSFFTKFLKEVKNIEFTGFIIIECHGRVI